MDQSTFETNIGTDGLFWLRHSAVDFSRLELYFRKGLTTVYYHILGKYLRPNNYPTK